MNHLLNFNELTATAIEQALNYLDTFKREWKVSSQLNVEQEQVLRELATIQSVGSSTRIEGAKMEDEEIANFIKNMEIRQLSSRDEQEVMGYYHVLEIINEMYADLPLSVSTLLGLHKELLRHSDKDDFHKGQFKKHSNQVVATHSDGRQQIIFETCDPLLTPIAVQKALDWYQESQAQQTTHPLLAIAIFVYEFLSIHPFQDGNGRLSRLITHLLLLQQGYTFIQLASLERLIEEDKAGYYKALMSGQRKRGMPAEECGRWVYFLLHALKRLSQQLEQDEQDVVAEPAVLYLNKRQRKVLHFIRQEKELSIGEIDKLLPLISRNTLKYDLAKLTEAGILVQNGKGRGTVYVAARNKALKGKI